MKNTEFAIQAVDALALQKSLLRQTNVLDAYFVNEALFEIYNPYDKEDWDSIIRLCFKMDRIVIENDIIIGHKEFIGILKTYHKREFNVWNVAWAISPLLVFPVQLDQLDRKASREELDFEYSELKHCLDLAIIDINEFVQNSENGRDFELGEDMYNIDEIVKRNYLDE